MPYGLIFAFNFSDIKLSLLKILTNYLLFAIYTKTNYNVNYAGHLFWYIWQIVNHF